MKVSIIYEKGCDILFSQNNFSEPDLRTLKRGFSPFERQLNIAFEYQCKQVEIYLFC